MRDLPSPFAGELSRHDATRLAGALKALADPARLQILSLLRANDEMVITAFPEPLGLSQPTVSHHVTILVDAGLVVRGRNGTFRPVRADPAGLAAIVQAITPPGRRLR